MDDERVIAMGATGTVPEMVYAVSHDIGEPMREIVGFANLLASRAPKDVDEKFWEDLHHVEQGAQRARSMLNALCAYIEAEHGDLSVASINLEHVAKQAADTALKACTETPVSVDVAVEPTPILKVLTYDNLVQDLIIEFVTNAARFARPCRTDQPEVKVWIQAGTESLAIEVTDNGPGLDEQAQQKATQLFQRLHKRSEIDTVGAGLALARRRIESCGGTLELGCAPQGGLAVTASLPYPASPANTSGTYPASATLAS